MLSIGRSSNRYASDNFLQLTSQWSCFDRIPSLLGITKYQFKNTQINKFISNCHGKMFTVQF